VNGSCLTSTDFGMYQASQVDVFILEPPWIDDGAGCDQRHDAPDVLTPIQRDDGVTSTVVQVKGEEIPSLEAAADDELVPVVVKARVLQVLVVLIRPSLTSAAWRTVTDCDLMVLPSSNASYTRVAASESVTSPVSGTAPADGRRKR
jgi:hypothetical protein